MIEEIKILHDEERPHPYLRATVFSTDFVNHAKMDGGETPTNWVKMCLALWLSGVVIIF
jgi:hypothetical protein